MKKRLKFITISIVFLFLFNLIGFRYTEGKDPYQYLYEYTVDKNNILRHMDELGDSRGYFKYSAKSYFESIKRAKIAQSFVLDAREEKEKGKKKEYYEKAIESVSKAIEQIDIASKNYGILISVWTKENIFEPLEMKNTFFYDDHEKVVKNRAYSYYRTPEKKYKKSVLSYANVGATSLSV